MPYVLFNYIFRCYRSFFSPGDVDTENLGSGFIWDGQRVYGGVVRDIERGYEHDLTIPPEILDFQYNEDFIIVKQRVDDLWPEYIYGFYGPDKEYIHISQLYEHGRDFTYYWLKDNRQNTI